MTTRSLHPLISSATGIRLKGHVVQDDDALDNIDSYWQAAIISPDGDAPDF